MSFNLKTLSKKRLVNAATVTLLTLTPAMWGACGHAGHEEEHAHEEAHEEKEHDHEGIIVFTDEQAKAGSVAVEAVGTQKMSGVISCSGQILSAQSDERTVTSPLAGVVSFAGKELTPGEAVSAGQRLFSISARDIVQSDPTASLRAELANAQANLARVKEQYENRLVTKAEYDQAVAMVNSARAALANPGAAPVKAASASSPISGYVTSTLVKPGDYVEIGAPLATVSTNRRLQLRADVPQSMAGSLSSVTSANIVLPGPGDTPLALADYNAKVISYGKGSADGIYVPVIIEFDNPGSLVAGSPVEAKLLTDTGAACLAVPRTAITEEEGIYFVYVQQSPEHYRKQQVSRGRDNGISVEITSGLKDGDLVVTKGATLLKLAANSGKAPEGHSHHH